VGSSDSSAQSLAVINVPGRSPELVWQHEPRLPDVLRVVGNCQRGSRSASVDRRRNACVPCQQER
jgi:hypothetical protein